MVELIRILIKFLVEGRSQLSVFEDFTSRYSKPEADKVEGKLKTLEEALMIRFQRKEYGFRILVSNMERLKKYK